MKKKLKSMIALILMLALVSTNFITVSAADKKGYVFVQDKMTFKITKTATPDKPGEVTITSYASKKSTKELNIPGTVEYNKMKYKVTSIDKFSFQNSKFKKVKIPNTVTNIGNSAFRKCTNLTSITVPKNVTLGMFIFRECTSLKSAILSEGITSIPTSTFYGCSQLTTVKIPNTVSKIDNFAFSKTKLQEVVLPKELTEIGQDAFSNCKALTSIYIPSTVKTVGMYAFKGCTSLTATIPKYTLYEKDLIDSNIKYNYSDESMFLVEQLEANSPEDGIVYYKITNTTPTNYINFSVGYLFIDSIGDEIGGGGTIPKSLFKSGDATVFEIYTEDKTYTDIKLIVTGDIISKAYKDMSSYITVSLNDDPTDLYDQFLEITSTSPKQINTVNVDIVFFKNNKVVYISDKNFYGIYKGGSKERIHFPKNLDYTSYTMNITAYNEK